MLGNDKDAKAELVCLTCPRSLNMSHKRTSVCNVSPSQATLKKVKEWLESGKDVRFGDWSLDEVSAACGTSRTTR